MVVVKVEATGEGDQRVGDVRAALIKGPEQRTARSPVAAQQDQDPSPLFLRSSIPLAG